MYDYPEYLMKMVRQFKGLDDEDDTSLDNEIKQMSPSEFFNAALNWDGDIGAGPRIQSWVEDIWGIKLPDYRVTLPRNVY